jgi:hypothetical protein
LNPSHPDPLQVLKQAQAIIERMKQQLDDADLIMSIAREYALELLLALDESQPHHQQRPQAWVINCLHELLELLDGEQEADK